MEAIAVASGCLASLPPLAGGEEASQAVIADTIKITSANDFQAPKLGMASSLGDKAWHSVVPWFPLAAGIVQVCPWEGPARPKCSHDAGPIK